MPSANSRQPFCRYAVISAAQSHRLLKWLTKRSSLRHSRGTAAQCCRRSRSRLQRRAQGRRRLRRRPRQQGRIPRVIDKLAQAAARSRRRSVRRRRRASEITQEEARHAARRRRSRSGGRRPGRDRGLRAGAGAGDRAASCKLKGWKDAERIVVGGGFRGSRVGELAIGRAVGDPQGGKASRSSSSRSATIPTRPA